MTNSTAADETSPTTHALWFGIALADVIAFVGLCLTVVLIYIAQRRVERAKSFEIKYHGIYIITTALILFFAPFELRSSLFSPFAVMVVGSVYPIYESIYAVCTLDEGDDTLWLQYWVAQGTLSFSTEWIDDLEPSDWQQRWFEFEFFFMLWLSLPWTNGAALLQMYVTTPLIEPTLRPLIAKMDSWISKFMMMAVNATHLWFLWAAFEFLPASWKRMVWIGIGVVFPIGSSMVAIVTPGGLDDTFWLTYWSTFGILFLLVDLLEDFIGFIPGYYTVAIFITVYLMVPMFQGADKIFRHVLVPLAGLEEMLIRKDAELVKLKVMRGIPEDRRDTVLKEIAESYLAGSQKGGYSSIAVV
eukprot:CAMPEP_0198250674 /NCGR_PEP_ID=MMETSP1447-20131203/1762_1 /TAXON_ID=420782 /ORGANISM="Chaetoceros dichaeta, Strain CCMP1751" /LENGTH=357 /DNA_ID=CAMNT_0043935531 /DNA_START=69 /DNA_END=1142 /DNA_ORIENTATION=-